MGRGLVDFAVADYQVRGDLRKFPDKIRLSARDGAIHIYRSLGTTDGKRRNLIRDDKARFRVRVGDDWNPLRLGGGDSTILRPAASWPPPGDGRTLSPGPLFGHT